MSKFITSDPPYNAGLYPTSAGFLELANGVALSSTLTNVTDQLNNASTLYLSTEQVKIGTTANDNPLALFGLSGLSAIFNTNLISVEDKTFTFPNANMTFAGINIDQTFTGRQTFNSGNLIISAKSGNTGSYTIKGEGINNQVSLTLPNITADDTFALLGTNQNFAAQVSAQSFRLTGTGGAGHLHLLFQSGDPTLASATTTVLYGDNAGNLRLKNGANNRTTTFSTSANGQDSTYTFPNVASTTLAGLSVAQTFTATQTISNIKLGPSAGVGGTLNLGDGGNGSSILAAGLQMYNFSSRHRFDGDGTGSAFVGNVYIGANSAASARLHIKSDGSSSVFRIDNSTPQRLFEVDNNNRFILGNSGLLFSWANNNFALTSQLASGYSYIFGNANTKSSASSAMGTFQLNETVSNPSGSSAAYRGIELNYTINNSSGAVSGTATGIFLNATETGSGLNGMTHNLIDLQTTVSGVTASKFKVNSLGEPSFSSANVTMTSSTFSFSNGIFSPDSFTRWGGGGYMYANVITNCRFHVNTGGLNVEVNASTAQNASAILQLTSTTKGFLPPVMTTTQKNAISSPATGLIIFDSTLGKLCVYGGAAWQTVTSV